VDCPFVITYLLTDDTTICFIHNYDAFRGPPTIYTGYRSRLFICSIHSIYKLPFRILVFTRPVHVTGIRWHSVVHGLEPVIFVTIYRFPLPDFPSFLHFVHFDSLPFVRATFVPAVTVVLRCRSTDSTVYRLRLFGLMSPPTVPFRDTCGGCVVFVRYTLPADTPVLLTVGSPSTRFYHHHLYTTVPHSRFHYHSAVRPFTVVTVFLRAFVYHSFQYSGFLPHHSRHFAHLRITTYTVPVHSTVVPVLFNSPPFPRLFTFRLHHRYTVHFLRVFSCDCCSTVRLFKFHSYIHFILPALNRCWAIHRCCSLFHCSFRSSCHSFLPAYRCYLPHTFTIISGHLPPTYRPVYLHYTTVLLPFLLHFDLHCSLPGPPRLLPLLPTCIYVHSIQSTVRWNLPIHHATTILGVHSICVPFYWHSIYDTTCCTFGHSWGPVHRFHHSTDVTTTTTCCSFDFGYHSLPPFLLFWRDTVDYSLHLGWIHHGRRFPASYRLQISSDSGLPTFGHSRATFILHSHRSCHSWVFLHFIRFCSYTFVPVREFHSPFWTTTYRYRPGTCRYCSPWTAIVPDDILPFIHSPQSLWVPAVMGSTCDSYRTVYHSVRHSACLFTTYHHHLVWPTIHLIVRPSYRTTSTCHSVFPPFFTPVRPCIPPYHLFWYTVPFVRATTTCSTTNFCATVLFVAIHYRSGVHISVPFHRFLRVRAALHTAYRWPTISDYFIPFISYRNTTWFVRLHCCHYLPYGFLPVLYHRSLQYITVFWFHTCSPRCYRADRSYHHRAFACFTVTSHPRAFHYRWYPAAHYLFTVTTTVTGISICYLVIYIRDSLHTCRILLLDTIPWNSVLESLLHGISLPFCLPMHFLLLVPRSFHSWLPTRFLPPPSFRSHSEFVDYGLYYRHKLPFTTLPFLGFHSTNHWITYILRYHWCSYLIHSFWYIPYHIYRLFDSSCCYHVITWDRAIHFYHNSKYDTVIFYHHYVLCSILLRVRIHSPFTITSYLI